MIKKLQQIFRLLFIWMVPLSLYFTARRLRIWVKKNKKEQDPNLNSLDKRWEFIRKRNKSNLKRLGIKIEVINKDRIPSGASWFFPNHSSNFDAFYLIAGLGGTTPLIPIGRDTLNKTMIASGFILGADGYYIKRNDIRDTVKVLTAVAQYSKSVKRNVVLFPEGTRSLTTDLLDFKDGSFKFPQKYFSPIIPVTILGTMQAKRWWILSERTVKIVIGNPLKGTSYLNTPTYVISRLVKEQINKELQQYYDSLSDKEKLLYNRLKQKNNSLQIKKDKKYYKELGV